MEKTDLEQPLKILEVDAWRNEEGWYWNNACTLETGVHISPITPRRVARLLRQWGYLTDESKGRILVEMDLFGEDVFIEIQVKSTKQPLLAIVTDHYA